MVEVSLRSRDNTGCGHRFEPLFIIDWSDTGAHCWGQLSASQEENSLVTYGIPIMLAILSNPAITDFKADAANGPTQPGLENGSASPSETGSWARTGLTKRRPKGWML